MDRTIWNDGVEVTQVQLANEHDALAENILQRWVDGMQTGVASGLQVTVNGINDTLVDLSLGHGYAQNGEWTELAAPVGAIGLSDYTNGVDNYVCLIYTEVASLPAAHETSGTTRNTKASRSSSVRVYTLDELNALPTSSILAADGSVDFTVDTRDRILICAIVNANGAAVPLTTGNISNVLEPTRILTITQPSVMTGIEVIAIDAETPTTAERLAAGDAASVANAELEMTFSGSDIEMAYKAPGDAAAGATETVTAGGSFTLTATSGYTVTIRAYVEALPIVGTTATITEALTVADFYEESVPLASATDHAHRHAAGTTVPSLANPHGHKLEEMGGALQRVLGTLILGAGLTATRAQALVPRLFTAQVDTATSARTLLWETETDAGYSVRFYVGGVLGNAFEITVNALYYQDAVPTAVWVKDTDGTASYYFSVAVAGASFAYRAAGAGAWNDLGWSAETLGIVGSTGQVSVPGDIALGLQNTTSIGGIHTPRITAPFGSGAGLLRTLMWKSAGSPTTGLPVRVYIGNGLLGNGYFEVTVNASWDQSLGAGTGQWVTDSGSYDSSLLRFTDLGFELRMHLAASPSPWDDTVAVGAWDEAGLDLSFGLGTTLANNVDVGGNATVGGTVISGYNTTVAYPNQERFSADMYAVAGQVRWLVDKFLIEQGPPALYGRRYLVRDAAGVTTGNADAFHFEYTTGCYWDTALQRWKADDTGAAFVQKTIIGREGFAIYTKASPGTNSWVDAPPFATGPVSGRWDEKAIQLHPTGQLDINSVPLPNTLYGTNTPKAWGRILVGGAPSPARHSDGFNFKAVSAVGGVMKVEFHRPMANDDYIVQFSCITSSGGDDYVLLPWVTGAMHTDYFYVAAAVAGALFNLPSGDSVQPVTDWTTSPVTGGDDTFAGALMFTVYGNQYGQY